MSIYATWLHLDFSHEEDCAFWIEVEPGSFEPGDNADCTCGMPSAPLIYEGSHVLPSESDRKGGSVDVAAIPNHITRDGRDDGAEGLHDWLRLSVCNLPSSLIYEGRAYIEGGHGSIILARRHVERLRDTLTEWLDAEERC